MDFFPLPLQMCPILATKKALQEDCNSKELDVNEIHLKGSLEVNSFNLLLFMFHRAKV